MAKLTLRWKTDSDLDLRARDADGAAVTGGTATLTLVTADGETVLDEVSFSEEGSGVYTYQLLNDIAVSSHDQLTATVTFIKGSDQAYAEFSITVYIKE